MNIALDRERAPTTIVMAIAIILLLSSLVAVLWPKSTSADAKAKFDAASKKANDAYDKARASSEATKQTIAKETWAGVSGQISSIVTIVTAVATKHNVKVVSLRPQRVVDTGDLMQIPYGINAEGLYKDIQAFERDLENPENRLAVELYQVGSSDENSSKVNCTLTVMAYVADQTTTTTVTTTTTSATPAKTKTQQSAVKATVTVKPGKRK